MLELIVEHQAGISVLMQPLRGNSSAAQDFGEVIRTYVQQLHLTYGMTYLVANSALYSAANLQKLAQTHMKWITRVPATVSDAQAVLAHADPQAMTVLNEDYRYHELTSLYGGVQQRWILIYSAPRQTQPQRTVDQQWRKQSDKEAQALKQVCDTAFACEADARQALAAFAKDLQATFMTTSTVRAQPRYGKRGRPRQDAQPDHVVYTHVLQRGGKAVRSPLDPLCADAWQNLCPEGRQRHDMQPAQEAQSGRAVRLASVCGAGSV